MSYSSRKRYTSRREKAERASRNIKITVIFALLAILVLIVKNRHAIWDHIQTYL